MLEKKRKKKLLHSIRTLDHDRRIFQSRMRIKPKFQDQIWNSKKLSIRIHWVCIRFRVHNDSVEGFGSGSESVLGKKRSQTDPVSKSLRESSIILLLPWFCYFLTRIQSSGKYCLIRIPYRLFSKAVCSYINDFILYM